MSENTQIKSIKFQYRDKIGRLKEAAGMVEMRDNRIFFIKSPFECKDDIKSMKGSRWHGYETEGPNAGKKQWSIEDCTRNRINIAFMMGHNPLTWFERPLQNFEYRPLTRNGQPAVLMPHQIDMADAGLTYHYQIWAAEMGVGKSLSAQLVIEMSKVLNWYWVGPKTSIPNIKREFRLFGFPFEQINVEFLTYEGLAKRMDEWKSGNEIPQGVILDESSRCKTPTAQRTKAAQMLADLIREKYEYEGYVIEMSGTPSPKSPLDWFAQAEIAWPGFLKEGSLKALEQRLAFLVKTEMASGTFFKRTGWRDDERKCEVCGEYAEHDNHDGSLVEDSEDYHVFKPSVNEVGFMYERLQGLVVTKHKKDCLNLPEKRYRKITCKPSASTLRAARALADGAINAVTGMTLLRELSDGFQYQEKVDGVTKCRHCETGNVNVWVDPNNPEQVYEQIGMLDPETVMTLVQQEVVCPMCGGSCEVVKRVRETREVACPKEPALKLLLEENEEIGRVVIFAGFTGSVDRVNRICRNEGWDVVQCDGRGFQAIARDGTIVPCEPLDYWADLEKHPRVAFVAHPESGGMSLTLTEARMCIYWSNSWKGEYRGQSEDRVHRIGADLNRGVVIVDLIHLPSDLRVLEVIRDNRRLELMTLGEALGDINWDESGKEGELQIEEEVQLGEAS